MKEKMTNGDVITQNLLRKYLAKMRVFGGRGTSLTPPLYFLYGPSSSPEPIPNYICWGRFQPNQMQELFFVFIIYNINIFMCKAEIKLGVLIY
ncbi:hypothetical protein B5X24_HaOG202496 [Helicoverpa armigera]|uniref:Uncharacterized protein n=1 Tax=Helicoverpa armigera TaxID=29058 RepID=A0A2W1BX71_HELAM|nr:hypothetical protein B5X24_HaOG202496 [Helicoverpa armigera]